jgi:2-oxoglutarate/2-oxoacid ferredoxin oxidoreductase subunit alpha
LRHHREAEPRILKILDRGELITAASSASGPDGDGGYKRYKSTDSGISPRAIPGVPGHIHTAATDEHDEEGVLISDEFTNPPKRRAMLPRNPG